MIALYSRVYIFAGFSRTFTMPAIAKDKHTIRPPHDGVRLVIAHSRIVCENWSVHCNNNSPDLMYLCNRALTISIYEE